MNVKKIFIMLITIVACVILGAFVLNVLMPNVVTTVINAVEQQIWRATGLSFDFNADNITGGSTGQSNNGQNGVNTDTTVTGKANTGIEGFDIQQ